MRAPVARASTRVGRGTRGSARSWSPARLCVIAAILACLVTAAPAPAAPPDVGVLVPGRSLGGVELGWTRGQVEAAWGRAYGRCRNCRYETLYFNRFAFRPEGAGVELRRGRVVAVFTLWAPSSWTTTRGVRVGDPLLRVNGVYGALLRLECPGYTALLLPGRGARSAIYVVDREVWGFGLQRRDVPVCRR
jgi:hypothetical protein